jgi:cell division inhibitor SulA
MSTLTSEYSNHLINTNISKARVIKSARTINNLSGLTIKESVLDNSFVDEFINICQSHNKDERWVLMIDPQEQDIFHLCKSTKINQAKILRINSKKVNLAVINIEKTLAKGNCSAVILCNASFGKQQLSAFEHYAKQGKTQCIVLKNSLTLH